VHPLDRIAVAERIACAQPESIAADVDTRADGSEY
jgi:hypothetical protein